MRCCRTSGPVLPIHVCAELSSREIHQCRRPGAHKLRAVARRLDGWLERRRLAAAAMRELAAMSDFELRDIRLSRYDVEHL